MFGFFWTRSASLGLAAVYMGLGLVFLLFPEMTGTVFCWALAAGAAAFSAARLVRWRQADRAGHSASGELVIGLLFVGLAVFCVLGERIILSFVPLVSGLVLLVDGIGKLPLALDAKRDGASVFAPLLASALVPLILGIVMMADPFGVTRVAIRFLGISLLLDGICDLGTVLYARSQEK